MKYVVLERMGRRFVHLFDEVFQHIEAVEHLRATPVSAGVFCVTRGGDVIATGDSMTLGLKSQPGDADLIRERLQQFNF